MTTVWLVGVEQDSYFYCALDSEFVLAQVTRRRTDVATSLNTPYRAQFRNGLQLEHLSFDVLCKAVENLVREGLHAAK